VTDGSSAGRLQRVACDWQSQLLAAHNPARTLRFSEAGGVMSSEPSAKTTQIWTNPDSEDDEPSLVRLTSEALCLAKVPADDLEKTAATLASGGELTCQCIPLTAMTRLQGEEDDNELTVTYKQGESNTESVTIPLADRHKRDELLNALTDALGPGWQRKRHRTSRLRAVLWALGALAVVTFLTWIMYGEAQQIAAGRHLEAHALNRRARGAQVVMHWIEGLIGAAGVLILGGLLACGCLAWLCWTLASPPVSITVGPTSASD
jgi:hypothetical protein